MNGEQASVAIRPYRDEDRDAIVTLAPRLTEGVAAWRDADAVAVAVRGWVTGSLEESDSDDHGVLVAVRQGCVAGFVTVTTRRHFTGQVDAYIGELVVSAEVEGMGVGRALVDAAESWARGRGRCPASPPPISAGRPRAGKRPARRKACGSARSGTGSRASD
ncbi:GNAT family N-acetyltransferase [Nonomuraea sp. NPDC049152]|uniref:GNAT family N-acetyltransferase n=1 Tax=Nonomuraea sp. NPDC049152 TaxID=3154350 RepID=UPI0033D4E48C